MSEGRDSKGRFQPGHHLFPTSKGIRNGRKKLPQNELLEICDLAMPDIFNAMVKKAKQGDVRAAEFIRDFVYGKPKQGFEVAGGQGITLNVVYEKQS
jgi:hypothetical protein